MYDQGCSDREVMRDLKLTPASFKHLMSDVTSSNFAEIVEFGRMLARAWWERMGRQNLLPKGFQTQLYSLNMQNRFGWALKSEESNTNINIDSMDDVEMDSAIREYIKKFGKVKG
jgi:hypothetical protein